ncbi:hypothetical protein GCM10023115_14520 [Pontixanthobacter gangjinensis]|uniref:DUF1801 domain-containing protein n=1 Tax=Pontixanthobacter gangjinensis TaxID=1028742 RepID=A0A6I4SPD3_9SPHN|nr:DUF1801 domain-containing protein [Pontixanthobacter gangjinensis]MXO56697.1 DUF1801 domain-containing protein [Pontixanthobacter gangjinensis]
MAEAKTRPTSIGVKEFIDSVEHEKKREEAKTLDAIFRRVTACKPAMWGPSIIGYGSYRTTYESGRDVHWLRTGFSPRKAKHSVYLMGGYCDELTGKRRDFQLERLGKYSRGKSCLYINKLADVDMAVLEEMIAEDWATMNRLYPE